MREANWHGLLLEYSVCWLDACPDRRPDFQVDSLELVKVEDETEFRTFHPVGDPEEIVDDYADEIEQFLYEEVTSERVDE